jgi:hypothetical protein
MRLWYAKGAIRYLLFRMLSPTTYPYSLLSLLKGDFLFGDVAAVSNELLSPSPIVGDQPRHNLN